MTDLLTTPELVSETVKEPARMWRNWWRSEQHLRAPDGGDIPRGVFSSGRIFATRQEAEAHAAWIMKMDAEAGLAEIISYLGARPIGERP